jgi:CHAT domain-containing protein/tetratricopeptide (TPR) repeat protein
VQLQIVKQFKLLNLIGIAAYITALSLPLLIMPAPLVTSQVLSQTQDARKAKAQELLQQGVSEFSSNQIEVASKSFQQALTIYREIKDKSGEWFASYFLGLIYSSTGNYAQGTDYLQQSLAIAKSLADKPKQWDTLNSLGGTFFSSKNFPKALDYYQQSLTVAKDIPDIRKQTQTLENLINLYKELGENAKVADYQQQLSAIQKGTDTAVSDPTELGLQAVKEGQQLMLQGTKESLPQAIALYEEALALFRKSNNQLLEATTLLSIATAYDDLGEKQKAIDYYNQGLSIAKTLNQPLFIATALVGIGSTYSDLGEQQQALKYFQQALPLLTSIGDKAGQSTTLNNIGGIYLSLADYKQALNYYNQSLALNRDIKNIEKEGSSLNNIGLVYASLGEYQKALDYYNQSLPIFQNSKEKFKQAIALDNIATVYFYLGQPQKALEYFNQALLLEENAGDRSKQATTLANMATVHSYLGENNKALDYYNQSLSILQALGDRFEQATVLSNIGGVYFDLGDHQKAADYYNQALNLSRSVGKKIEEATTLGKLGQLYYALKDYPQATDYLQQGLKLIREIGDRRVEGKILNTLGRVYLQSGKPTDAETTLRDTIKVWESIRADLGSNDINKISIFEEQAATYRLLQTSLIAQNKINEALEITERGRARAFVELLFAKISPQSQVQPPNIKQIQQIAKQHNATLVEYSIVYEDLKVPVPVKPKESKLLIWVIKPTGEIGFRQVDFRDVLRPNTTLADLVVNNRRELGVRGRGSSEASNNPSEESGARSPASKSQQLHKLLIEPIADLLPKDANERVVFIPQESLFLVPFSALQDSAGKYLIEKHTILTSPAIQVLDLTRQQRQRVAGKSSLVVGNPTMPSIPSKAGERFEQLMSLPGAEEEALSIAQLLKTQAITGKEATKSAVLQQLPQARIVHLATHGLLDDFTGLGIPGAIALAPNPNSNEKFNGLLTASEIVNLKLNSELVVLSACDTGRGRITGDGVVGLSRSLISAGVPSVIVSLWSIPDAPTSSLMTEFYKQLQQKPDKAQALRQAMLTTMKKYPHPSDWAAFTLVGEAE